MVLFIQGEEWVLMLNRATFLSNTQPLTKQTLPSRAQTAKSCLSRRSRSTLPSFDLLLQARGALAITTSARVDVVQAGQGAGVLAVTAQIWRIEQQKEYAGSCQYRIELQWKSSSTVWVAFVASKCYH
jgi:hypothetical protein